MNKSSNFDIKVAQQIIDQTIMNNKPHYLIKWKYLPHQHDTWESLQNLQSIVDMIQKWIKTKRQFKQSAMSNNASSFCDTVNFINPNKKIRRKRKINSKKIIHKSHPNQIVVIEEQEDQIEQSGVKKIKTQPFIQQESQSILQEETQTDYTKISCSQIIQNSENIDPKILIKYQNQQKPENQIKQNPLKFDPQEAETIPSQQSEKVKTGMKVIGRVSSQDIENILQYFTFKDQLVFKIQLKDGRIMNMRENDLKKMCPQMLMEFYEDNDMEI